jgi:PAS domain S-box-containing protein
VGARRTLGMANDTPRVPPLSPALVRWLNVSADRGVFITDREFRIVFWNRWLEEQSGRSQQDMIGRLLFEVYPDLTARGIDQFFRNALNGEVCVISHQLHGYLLEIPARAGGMAFTHMPQRARIEPFVDGDIVVGATAVIDSVIERRKSRARRQSGHCGPRTSSSRRSRTRCAIR